MHRGGNHLTRRQFVAGAGILSAGAAALTLAAGCARPPWSAPAPRLTTVGLLTSAARTPLADMLRQELGALGYVEGQNLAIEARYAATETAEQLAPLAADLVQRPVDIVVTVGDPATRAVLAASWTVPIVMALGGVDPIAARLIASLARPGGNVTGLTTVDVHLGGKKVELLARAAPGLARLAVLWNAAMPDKALELGQARAAARVLGVAVQPLPVRDPADFDRAFDAARQEGANGLLALEEELISSQRSRILAFAAANRLPSMFSSRVWVDGGGLMSYGPDWPALFGRTASYVDRIARGARPADLPVEQPTRFDLVVNLKTARALGITFPDAILLEATES
jgi:putative ABC transport system substrate-binding protein